MCIRDSKDTAENRIPAEISRVGEQAFLIACLRASIEQGDRIVSVRLLRALATLTVNNETKAMLPGLAGWLNKASKDHGWDKVSSWAAKRMPK